jgi:hypothetical protein
VPVYECEKLDAEMLLNKTASGACVRYSDNDIDSIVLNLNTTPRKCLGFKTPIEAFASQLGVALEM